MDQNERMETDNLDVIREEDEDEESQKKDGEEETIGAGRIKEEVGGRNERRSVSKEEAMRR